MTGIVVFCERCKSTRIFPASPEVIASQPAGTVRGDDCVYCFDADNVNTNRLLVVGVTDHYSTER